MPTKTSIIIMLIKKEKKESDVICWRVEFIRGLKRIKV